MIQINLLPDVKLQYIKAKRLKHTVIAISILASIVALAIVILFCFIVFGAQALRLSSLNNDIKSNTTTLQNIDGLDKILTIQNQLKQVGELHNNKPVASRLYTFLPQLTPADVQISNVDLKFEDNSLVITGTAKGLEQVNKYVDTLKYTKYTTNQSQDQKQAFSNVVLSSFGRSDKEATYTITTNFDPELFSNDYTEVKLAIPNVTTTRLQPLFNEQKK
jgi:hypothetical protein